MVYLCKFRGVQNLSCIQDCDPETEVRVIINLTCLKHVTMIYLRMSDDYPSIGSRNSSFFFEKKNFCKLDFDVDNRSPKHNKPLGMSQKCIFVRLVVIKTMAYEIPYF